VVRWYDAKAAKWKQETVQISDEMARVPVIDTRKFADQERAKDRANSNAEEVERGKAGGTVAIDGEPSAVAQALCAISGIRPGTNGLYWLTGATHNFSRNDGWTTSCELARAL
jgi:hypothetical protein